MADIFKKKIILFIIGLTLGLVLIGLYLKENLRLGAIIPKEVPMYYEDINDQQYFKISANKIKTEITKLEYQNISLKEKEIAYSIPKLKLTQLKDGEYYRTNRTNLASTSAEIVIKLNGVEEIKFENELSK